MLSPKWLVIYYFNTYFYFSSIRWLWLVLFCTISSGRKIYMETSKSTVRTWIQQFLTIQPSCLWTNILKVSIYLINKQGRFKYFLSSKKPYPPFLVAILENLSKYRDNFLSKYKKKKLLPLVIFSHFMRLKMWDMLCVNIELVYCLIHL